MRTFLSLKSYSCKCMDGKRNGLRSFSHEQRQLVQVNQEFSLLTWEICADSTQAMLYAISIISLSKAFFLRYRVLTSNNIGDTI